MHTYIAWPRHVILKTTLSTIDFSHKQPPYRTETFRGFSKSCKTPDEPINPTYSLHRSSFFWFKQLYNKDPIRYPPKRNYNGDHRYIMALQMHTIWSPKSQSIPELHTLRLMDKILHYLKDPKLWELWYTPYYGSCSILSISRIIHRQYTRNPALRSRKLHSPGPPTSQPTP